MIGASERDANVAGAERAIAILTSSGRERDVAVWKTCAEIARTLNLFTPKAYISIPDGWRGEEQEAIEGLHRSSPDELPSAARALGRTFGVWRNAVLDLEGDNARKLQTLLWAVECVMGFARLEGADEERLGALVTQLGQHLQGVWKVGTQPKDYRSFALKHCRRYDLLPREWREL